MERTTAQLQTLKRAIMSAGIPDDDDDYEDPTPAGYGPNTSMPMPVAVVALNGAARLVPPGWRNLLTQTHHKVRGAIAQSVRRRHVAAGLKVIITDQELEFNFSVAPDPVLRGILRKATVRSRCTCSQCGRRGRVREIGDDYRKQVTATVDLDLLGHCAERYGVSLTAAILKWLQYTEEKAVLVMSRDGFMNWAWSSEPASKAGAFFRTRNNVIAVPNGSLAANAEINGERAGTQIPASIWFPHASADTPLREMKIHAEQYGVVLTLLHLPRSASVWPPWAAEE